MGVALLLVFTVASDARAANISLEQGDEFDWIYISGEIAESDVALFQRIAIGSEEAIVVLESDGGYLAPALKIGEIIRLKNFSTAVLSDSICSSSCALIWVAGRQRYLSDAARVGFHASYTVNQGRAEQTGLGNAMVGRYLTLLNLPESAVAFATSAPPNEIRWIDPSNARETGIDFIVLPFEPPAAPKNQTAQARGLFVEEFSWQGRHWGVLSSNDRESCFIHGQFRSNNQKEEYTFSVDVAADQRTAIFSFGGNQFDGVSQGEDYIISINFVSGDVEDAGWGSKSFSGVVHEGNWRSLATELEWADLRTDLLTEEVLSFAFDGEVIAVFELDGIRPAMRQLDRCLSTASN